MCDVDVKDRTVTDMDVVLASARSMKEFVVMPWKIVTL